MTLAFLNAARSYDPGHRCISFWGYDATFEKTFRLDVSALQRLVGHDDFNEAEILKSFDANLKAIREIAERLYRQKPVAFSIISARDL